MNRQNDISLIIILIIIALIFIGIVGALGGLIYMDYIDRSNNMAEDQEVTKKEVESPEIELYDFEVFMDGLRETTEIYCEDFQMYEREHIGEYKGFPWINKNNEVELIKGYDLFATHITGDIREKCSNHIITYLLEENLISNAKNTDSEMYVFGFEKGGTKCVFDSYYCNLKCGDATKNTTPKVYRELYSYLNPEMDLSVRIDVKKIVDNFATVATRNYVALLKKTGGEWTEIDGTQDRFECEIVFEHEVPPSLIDNKCMFYETTRKWWGYNEELDKWEEGYESDEGKG